jgi:hypothetical protein
MRSWPALPEVPIGADAPLSHQCRDRGLGDLRSLGRALCALPYGRGPERSRFADVLDRGRGTCSSKHAFLCATARENAIPLELVLGLYEMHEGNTPGVGAALAAGGLDAVPEAHCYARWDGERVDLTRSGQTPREPIHFLSEETIDPAQIGDYKVDWHRRRLEAWCRERGWTDWTRVWHVREACIQALSEA